MVDLYWNVFQYLILPAGVAVCMCLVKRKCLWASPLISGALLVLAYWMMFPDLFSNYELRGWLVGIYLPIHLVMAVIFNFLVSRVSRKK